MPPVAVTVAVVVAILVGAVVAVRWLRARRIARAIACFGSELHERYARDGGWRERFQAGDDATLRELVEIAAQRAGITRAAYEKALAQRRWADRQRAAILSAMAGVPGHTRPPIAFGRPSRRTKTAKP